MISRSDFVKVEWYDLPCVAWRCSPVALDVDNGPKLPLWDRLSTIAFWISPSAFGLPLLGRTLRRYASLRSDLRTSIVRFGAEAASARYRID